MLIDQLKATMDCLDRGLLSAIRGTCSSETVHDQKPVHGQKRVLQAILKSMPVTPTTPNKEVKQRSPKKGSKCLKCSVEDVATSSPPADQAAQDVTTPTDQATQDVATPPPKKKPRRRPFKDVWDQHGKRWANEVADTRPDGSKHIWCVQDSGTGMVGCTTCMMYAERQQQQGKTFCNLYTRFMAMPQAKSEVEQHWRSVGHQTAVVCNTLLHPSATNWRSMIHQWFHCHRNIWTRGMQ